MITYGRWYIVSLQWALNKKLHNQSTKKIPLTRMTSSVQQKPKRTTIKPKDNVQKYSIRDKTLAKTIIHSIWFFSSYIGVFSSICAVLVAECWWLFIVSIGVDCSCCLQPGSTSLVLLVESSAHCLLVSRQAMPFFLVVRPSVPVRSHLLCFLRLNSLPSGSVNASELLPTWSQV